MTARNRKPGQTKPPEYKPTPREIDAVIKQAKEQAGQAPRVKVSKDGSVAKVALDHPDMATGLALLMESLGTADSDFFNGFFKQLVNATSQAGAANEADVNFMLSVVKGIEPCDQIEAMLAAQMAAVHSSIMTFARRLTQVETIPQQDSAERAFNKLARTFAAQMEALKRYRTGGEQKVTVQHVTVGEGGQAIVGNVTQGRREAAPDKAAAPPLAIADAKTASMSIIENPTQAPVAVPRSSKKK
jgi:hypothetical protein